MIVRKYRNLVALGLVLTVGVATPALATESGVYLGLNLGQSKYEVNESDIEDLFGDTGLDIDKTDVAWSLAVGYRFQRYMGVELSYLDMGKTVSTVSDTFRFGNTTYTYSGEASAAVKGPALAFVAAIPIKHFEINARLGVMQAHTNITLSESVTQGSTVLLDSFDEASSTSSETLYGLGMGYTFGEHAHLRIDWIMVPDAGDDEETGEGDVAVITAGFQYRF